MGPVRNGDDKRSQICDQIGKVAAFLELNRDVFAAASIAGMTSTPDVTPHIQSLLNNKSIK